MKTLRQISSQLLPKANIMKFTSRFVLLLIGCWIAACAPSAAADDLPINQLTASEERGGWELLFDGTSTAGWRNYQSNSISEGWIVRDGALSRVGKGAGDLVTEKKYAAFEMTLEYRISQGGNSGVMFHVMETEDKPWKTGPEIQIQDNVGGSDPEKSGWLYQFYKSPLVKPVRRNGGKQPAATNSQERIDATRPAGEWNQLYIRIAPGDCLIMMNGLRYSGFSMGDEQWNKLLARSKFSAFPNFGNAGEGHICLQDHGNEVAFRNIKIREIDGENSGQPIDGKLNLTGELAFPDLEWEDWEPIDESGNVRQLRIIELAPTRDDTNRLFAVSQVGRIWVFENRYDVTEAKLFLDLRDKVFDWKNNGGNENGLLGIAPHPKFKTNGQFYVYYTDANENKTRVSRFLVSQDDPNRADISSEQIVLEIDQPFKNHNGGSMEFGPDGYLYVGLGDGGSGNDPFENGQNIGTLKGSILRIDVDHPQDGMNYGIPVDNPFVNVEGARPEIYAYGLRNVWRLSFDSKTGNLWCGDVGQAQWEEINIIQSGGNYGWSVREGTHPFSNRTLNGPSEPIDPIWDYGHTIGKSITGGRVYRGSRIPELAGKYVYADYITGRVWALDYDFNASKVRQNLKVSGQGLTVLAFGHDEAGELYYMVDSVRGECIYRFSHKQATDAG